MTSRHSAVRLRQFEVDEKRRKVADLESMIAEFNKMAGDLERQIEAEQTQSGISDVNHFAYPTFAKAAIQRRENLLASIADLGARLEKAHGELDDAVDEFKKVEMVEERDRGRGERHSDVGRSRLRTFSSQHSGRLATRGV